MRFTRLRGWIQLVSYLHVFLFFFTWSIFIHFSCGSYNFSLNELITAGENGMIFKTAGDLADQLLSWFRGFPRENGAHRQHFRGQLTVYQNLRWHEEWSKVALPVMSSI